MTFVPISRASRRARYRSCWYRPAIRVTAALCAAAVLGAPTPAAAHTDLASAAPRADSTLTRAPKVIRLVFSGPVQADLATVTVRGPLRRNIATGEAEPLEQGLVQSISEPTRSGSYKVAYRVISTDGHPITGSYTFRYDPPTPAAGQESAVTEPDDAAQAGSDVSSPKPESEPSPVSSGAAVDDTAPATSSEPASAIAPAMVAGAVIAIIGIGALVRRRRRPSHDSQT